jgi:molecular chaperone GrpE (heat shock protein)
MTLSDLQREIAALPTLTPPQTESKGKAEGEISIASPLDIVTRQGRLILRLIAATEAVEGRYRELAAQNRDIATQMAERDGQIEEQREARKEADRRLRQMATEVIHLMDALDWVYTTLNAREDSLVRDVAAAQRDCLRRLAAVGITEIPTNGIADGRLHEGVDTTETSETEQYHIVSVVRRGFQLGPEILRRAEVITAA